MGISAIWDPRFENSSDLQYVMWSTSCSIASTGVTIAVDADDSGTVWKPDIGGAAVVSFGVNVGITGDAFMKFTADSMPRHAPKKTQHTRALSYT